MAITVSRYSYFKAIAATDNLETLYAAIPSDKDDPVWLEFNSSPTVTEGDVLAVATKAAYSWSDAQMSALFALAATYDGGPNTNPTAKLDIYNKALRHLGERKLASLSENREARRYLDDEYTAAIDLSLRSGLWNFAMRAIMLDSTSSVTPAFGYSAAFPKPADWVRTSVLSLNETLDPPLRFYQDQDGYWLCNADTLYARYVSSDLGYTLANWPADYAEYVGVVLAVTIAPRITQSDTLTDKLAEKEKEYRKRAMANDAMDQASALWPSGTWVTGRVRRGTVGLSNNIRYW